MTRICVAPESLAVGGAIAIVGLYTGLALLAAVRAEWDRRRRRACGDCGCYGGHAHPDCPTARREDRR